MSAIVCGKRSLFEDLAAASPPVSKKLRCFSSSSSSRFSPPIPPSSSLLLDHLAAIFPDMDKQILERAIEECGDDLDSAIRCLNQLRLESANKNSDSATNQSPVVIQEPNVEPQQQGRSAKEEPNVLNLDGTEWVELFVREMMNASDMKDAKARAARALEALEKSINARTGTDAMQNLQQENMMLKQQLEAIVQENSLLKRAVVTQQKRQRESEDQSQELQHLRQLVTQYQEQLRTLEVNNYALTLHLKQAQQNSSIPGRYHPDVF
ncbi:Ubiquitin system component Cue protein [Arabidopsis thaliana]|uniref:Ubiquitin system component Cue protein n=1 Tax=Arabidopsis thaliana TaxID=3702 RepID=F4KED5_ARATH|nr:Ubiquitin system component Cue protein [Arabidopsis thaliana]AED93881.1 Ubiquitin system component Cue protein [Arabidopsis thaliana]|eukprot:NP_001190418.1 Ubiquitin system component Cue protein [Arabidopsis thaliana]